MKVKQIVKFLLVLILILDLSVFISAKNGKTDPTLNKKEEKADKDRKSRWNFKELEPANKKDRNANNKVNMKFRINLNHFK